MPVQLGRRQGESVTWTQTVPRGREDKPGHPLQASCVQLGTLGVRKETGWRWTPCPVHTVPGAQGLPSRAAGDTARASLPPTAAAEPGSAWVSRCRRLRSLLVKERLAAGAPSRAHSPGGGRALCGSVHPGVPRWIAPTGGARNSLTGSQLTRKDK